MMQITIPRIVRPIELSDYAPELSGVRVYVWVNAPRDFYARHAALLKENDELRAKLDQTKAADEIMALGEAVRKIGSGFVEFFCELWSQAADAETHWTVESVSALITLDTDPGLYGWLCRRSFELVLDHKAAGKKK